MALPVPAGNDPEHLKILLVGAGIIMASAVSLICWLLKRDLGKMDGTLKTITETLVKQDSDFTEHEKKVINRFGKIDVRIAELDGDIKLMAKVHDTCPNRGK